jgi:hypothetical protein
MRPKEQGFWKRLLYRRCIAVRGKLQYHARVNRITGEKEIWFGGLGWSADYDYSAFTFL